MHKFRNLALRIPGFPPDYRTLSFDKVRFLLFCEKMRYILCAFIFLTTILTKITRFWKSQSSGSASPCAGAVAAHRLCHMPKGVQGECRRVMPKVFFDGQRVVAVLQGERHKRMTKRVEIVVIVAASRAQLF